MKKLDCDKEQIEALYAENKKITDGNFDKSLAVKCVNGTFVGKKDKNIIAYKGIPFVGKQPVGSLRWKAPAEAGPDDGVYEAYHYGKAPVQSPGDIAAEYGTSEDCLYLNIWKANEAASEKKPVIVWIYGGGFEVGGATDPQYDCSSLVEENPDIMVVTVSYRVSFLGFLHLSHLPDGKDFQDAP
ncbi:carboxylesterase family protein, partial [bacterium]|nr:carboxylesterase family protein [bacterium]